MCGQCGVFSPFFGLNEKKIFKYLLFLNAFRGEDSTGVTRIEKTPKDTFKVEVRKSLLSSPEFLGSEHAAFMEFDIKDSKNKLVCLMGHTRAATKGQITLENAHPFRFKNVIGSHNGTIHKYFEGRKDFDTDSEAYYSLINQKGLLDATLEVNDWDSAYAIQYVDLVNSSLNFMRNDKRPLFFTYLYGGTTIVWSSEREHIEMVLKHVKAGSNTGWKASTKDKYFTLHAHDHYTIPLNGRPDEGSIVHLDIPEKKSYTTYVSGAGYSGGGSTTRTFPERTTSSQKGSTGSVERKQGTWALNEKTGAYEFTPYTNPTSGSTVESTTSVHGPSSIGPKSESRLTGDYSKTSSSTKEQEKSSASSETLKDRMWDDEGDTGTDASFRGYKDKFTPEGLQSLAWIDKAEPTRVAIKDLFDESEVPWEDKSKDVRRIKGFQGALMSDKEFSYRLGQGCSCCGTSYTLRDPHQFADINKIRWFDREHWVCDTCYQTSEGDWVKYVIDGWCEETATKES